MKIKTEKRASLIRLTILDLNKKGLLFAGFLLVGLVSVVVLSWSTLRETSNEHHTSFNSTVPSVSTGPSIPLATPTGLKTSNDSTSFDEVEVEMLKKRYERDEKFYHNRYKRYEEYLRFKKAKKSTTNIKISSLENFSPEKFKQDIEFQEYKNIYSAQIKNYDEREQQILKDYESYKISTFPTVGKDQLPKKKESGIKNFLNTWWDSVYGDVQRREEEIERRRLKSIGQ